MAPAELSLGFCPISPVKVVSDYHNNERTPETVIGQAAVGRKHGCNKMPTLVRETRER
jgi:hypothetical protein